MFDPILKFDRKENIIINLNTKVKLMLKYSYHFWITKAIDTHDAFDKIMFVGAPEGAEN